MKDKHTIKEFSFGELTQIALAVNRSEAARQKRYKRLAEQAEELLPHKEQPQHISRANQSWTSDAFLALTRN
jgi:hypothetical protein